MSIHPASPWPDGCEGAVSLAFDDGMKSQLERAIPYLDKLGLRGTFYVNPREGWEEQLKPWAAAAANGHEIGNHTVNHPCSRNLFGNEHGLEVLSLKEIEADILTAEDRLRKAIPNQAARSFCYPCYNDHVGSGAARQSYVPVVARHFPAGRGGALEQGHLNHPVFCDLHYLNSQPCERWTGFAMVGLCERAATQGRWLILTFHGIQEGYLSVSDGDFREVCEHLARHRKRFHVGTVVEVAQRIAQWRDSIKK